MNEILYNLDERISLVKNENDKYFVVNKDNSNLSFYELLNLENSLDEVSREYVNSIKEYKMVKDKINLRNMFNMIIYCSSALLCLCSTFIDVDMFLYILCIQFLVLKSILLFYYGTKNYLEDELYNINKCLIDNKNKYDELVSTYEHNKELVNYYMYPASFSDVCKLKDKCNKVYKLVK